MSTLPGGYQPAQDGTGREGEQNFGSARATHVGQGGRRGGRRGGRGRRGEQPMVPDAQFTSYYGRPVLKAAPWGADIPAYLFLGGVAGGSALLGAGADLAGLPALRRNARLGALGAITVSFGALVHDLGRPERFVNMLRVAKPTSPMSVGTWILSGFGPLAGIAAVAELTPLVPRPFRPLVHALARPSGLGAALLGPAVASYTAVLIADTATPAWHEGYRELPFVFVGSASVASGGLALLTTPVAQTGPARRLALAGAALELTAETLMERRMGLPAETLHTGKAGTMIKLAKACSVVGAAAAAASKGRPWTARLAGAALLAASAFTRFGIFEAGQESTRDPKYTIVPQAERVARRGTDAVQAAPETDAAPESTVA
ncbi:MAG: NrfD/PsrC family molybdoenzyme membrane anchor subunit [Jatrophihabitans sp.]|uniref:NrfD/PsrC family molybdoenzyme membrane anchor subunit n=1 Tax=Jatrophihabitans sp. TaxID=1932789 RepID=UPI003F7FE3F0